MSLLHDFLKKLNDDRAFADSLEIENAPTVSASSKSLVVFVHGLGATSKGTWGSFKELIASDTELSSIVDVAFFGYATEKHRFFFGKKYMKIRDIVASLRTELDIRSTEYSRVHLVGHSMGGLVVRQYVMDEVLRQADLKVSNVLLYAVPNYGAKIAELANAFSINHKQLTDVAEDSTFIESLNEGWKYKDIDSLVEVTPIVAGADEAVPRQSAQGLWGAEKSKTVADMKHTPLVQVQSHDDTSYLILRSAILGTPG